MKIHKSSEVWKRKGPKRPRRDELRYVLGPAQWHAAVKGLMFSFETFELKTRMYADLLKCCSSCDSWFWPASGISGRLSWATCRQVSRQVPGIRSLLVSTSNRAPTLFTRSAWCSLLLSSENNRSPWQRPNFDWYWTTFKVQRLHTNWIMNFQDW